MLSRDAYKERDYADDDFKYIPRTRLATVGDSMKDRVMGAGTKGKMDLWGKKYAAYFIGDEEKEDTPRVVIPRYSGPNNTRVDIHQLSGSTLTIDGYPNHAQSSCVYLKQTFQFRMEHANTPNLISNWLRPFTIQRQFQSLKWTAPQCSDTFDTSIQQQVRLAPYLCDAQMLKNCVKYKPNMVGQSLDQIAQMHHRYFNYTLFEPLLGFQSGYKVLDGSRPFNQQNMKYPLAIQDYSLQIQRFTQTKDILKRCVRDRRALIDTYEYEKQLDDLTNNVGRAYSTTTYQHGNTANLFPIDVIIGDIELVSFSEDTARQENKGVSEVLLHAPRFINYSEPIVLNPYKVQPPIRQDSKDPAAAIGAGDHATGQLFSTEVFLNQEVGTERCIIKCNTSKGYPSYFLIYIEDFGNDYFDRTFDNQGGGPPPVGQFSQEQDVGTDMLIGGHPKIYNMSIRIFGQDFPIVKNLGHDELEYITKKNVHPRCDLIGNMSYDPIVLLKLEDIGLATEDTGYPSDKRLELEVEINSIILSRNYIFRYPLFNDANGDAVQQPNPPMTAHCSFIYENHVLEGTNNRLDFVWKK